MGLDLAICPNIGIQRFGDRPYIYIVLILG